MRDATSKRDSELHEGIERIFLLANTMKNLLAYQTKYIGHTYTEKASLEEILKLGVRCKQSAIKDSHTEVTCQFDYSGEVLVQRAKFINVISSLIDNALDAMQDSDNKKLCIHAWKKVITQ